MKLRIFATSILLLLSPGISLECGIAQDQPEASEQRSRRFRPGDGQQGGQRGEGRRTGRQGGFAAQRRPGGRGFGGFGAGALLQNSDVREELGVDDAQFEELKTAGEEMRGKVGEFYQRMMTARQEGSDMGEIRRKMREMQTKLQEKVQAILSEAQYRRLKQAELQQRLRTRGVGALADRETATSLNLTDEQKGNIREELRSRFGSLRRRDRENRDSDQPAEESRKRRVRPETTALSFDDAREQAANILDGEQMKKLDEMLGREFELPQELLTMRNIGERGGARPVGQSGARRERRERPERPERTPVEFENE